jgi:hypothetical protein
MIKNILCLLICSLYLGACSKKIQPDYNAEVSFQAKDNDGTITVRSFGYGTNDSNAIADAQKNALSVILFKGIPGSELKQPLVTNEYESKNINSNYYKNLFDNKFSKTFIMSTDVISPLTKFNSTKRLIVNIKINFNSLRKDLENNSIIRKFGY